MPCSTISTTTVSLENLDRDRLADAMIALGVQLYWGQSTKVSTEEMRAAMQQWLGRVYDGSKLTIDQDTARRHGINEASVKRAYAAETVKAAAKKFGWQLQQKGERQYVAMRRG